MSRTLTTAGCALGLFLAVSLGLAAQPDSTGHRSAQIGQPTMRVGVYDNRAVTLAWFHSEHNDLGALHEQYQEAEAAGDQARMAELTELGPKRQRKLHFQGFGRAPVTDLLEPVRDRLDEVAAAAGVDAIAFECNFAAEGVEVVDITDELIKLYNPTAETRAGIAQLRGHDPVPLEDLRDEH